jgi:hypothetical protein
LARAARIALRDMHLGDCRANFFFSGCAKITAADDVRVAQVAQSGCSPKGLVANDKRDGCATEIYPSR